MSTIVTESMEEIATLISYQGFNPVEFIKHLRTIEPSQEILGQEMQVLCLLAVNRGVKISKVTQKMRPEGVKIVMTLCDKYRVKDSRPRNATDVTIARIAAAFPQSCAHHIYKGRGRVVGRKHPDLPSMFCFPAGGSLIPLDYVRTLDAWKEWRQSFSDVIRSQPTEVDYDTIVINSPILSDSERLKFCESHGYRGEMEETPQFIGLSEEAPRRKSSKQIK